MRHIEGLIGCGRGTSALIKGDATILVSLDLRVLPHAGSTMRGLLTNAQILT
jgi:hypothetical protein